MATEIKLPALGENVEEGEVVAVLVEEGDAVEKDQPLIELETDKATVEVPADVGGTVQKIHVSSGDTIKVGQVIVTVEAGDAKKEEESEELAEEEQEPKEKESKGKAAKKAEPEKADGEGDASKEREEKPKKKEDAKKAEAKASDRKSSRKGEVVDIREGRRDEAAKASEGPVPASPAVRRFAREIGVDIQEVSGSGPKGRISVEDVKDHSKVLHSKRRSASGAHPDWSDVELPDFARFGDVERERFSNVRRKTAQHLSTAWTLIPHVTQHDRADITRLETLRKQHSAKAEKMGGKLTITAIGLKIAAAALHAFPHFNASIDMNNEEIVLKKYFHIGVAVDTERGLLVPVIRDVDQKNILELSVELGEIAEKAREGKISLEDLQGGCFTITNLGGIGGTSFTPIVNFPEAAILGISRASVEPVHADDGFQPRLMMPLSLSYDHRLIDGADAARFLRWVCQAFEDPFLLALEG